MVKIDTKSWKVWIVQASCFVITLLSIVNVAKSDSPSCATLYSSNNSPFPLNDGDKQSRIISSGRYFWAQKARVSPQCVARIYDAWGNSLVMDKNEDSLGWFSQRPVDAACCECGGCASAAEKLDGYCARLYENERCETCNGFHLTLGDGDTVRHLGPTSGRMTSVAVRRGCVLNVYFEYNFDGWRYNFTESTNKFGDNWHKQIKSVMCGCNGISPTVRPTEPWITQPTVPTTQKPYWNTNPTYTTTRRLITLPTVPTTYRPYSTTTTTPKSWTTQPTVTTTTTQKPWTTQPTVTTTTTPKPTVTTTTTTTTNPPMTLPTVPTTKKPEIVTSESPEYDGDDDWFGGAEESDEQVPSSTPSSDNWPGFSKEEIKEEGDNQEPTQEESEEEEDEDDWW